MKLIYLYLCLFLVATTIKAQTNKLVAGTKLQVTEVSKMTNKTNAMGTEIEMKNTNNFLAIVTIKNIKDSTVVLESVIKKISGEVSAMGTEQKYDSDDSSTISNPMLGGLLQNVNKPEEIVVVNGKIKGDSDLANKSVGMITKALSGNASFSSSAMIGQLFIPIESQNKQVGYTWTTSERSNDSTMKINTIYTITKLSKDEIEITSNVGTTFVGEMKAMGMSIKENMSGISTATFTYNAQNGLLKNGTTDNTSTGTGEVMGNNIPINLKGVTTINVQ